MIRTQISLTAEQKHRLDALSNQVGASLSELIRRALDACYPPRRDTEADIAAITRAAGTWTGRDVDGAGYVADLRSGTRPTGVNPTRR